MKQWNNVKHSLFALPIAFKSNVPYKNNFSEIKIRNAIFRGADGI